MQEFKNYNLKLFGGKNNKMSLLTLIFGENKIVVVGIVGGFVVKRSTTLRGCVWMDIHENVCVCVSVWESKYAL